MEDRLIEQDGIQVKISVVRPKGANGVLPVFMFFHGGGWILGDYPTHERFVRDLVVDTGYAAALVNYTPSPEAQYPTAISEAFAASFLRLVSASKRRAAVSGSCRHRALRGSRGDRT